MTIALIILLYIYSVLHQEGFFSHIPHLNFPDPSASAKWRGDIYDKAKKLKEEIKDIPRRVFSKFIYEDDDDDDDEEEDDDDKELHSYRYNKMGRRKMNHQFKDDIVVSRSKKAERQAMRGDTFSQDR